MASFTVPCPKCLSFHHFGLKSQTPTKNIQLGFSKSQSFGSVSRDSVSTGIQCLERKQSSVWKVQAHPNEAATIENSSNSAPVLVNEPKVASPKEEDNHNGKPSGPSTSTDASSVSTFMNQVSELVKLVDSRDIVELQLKQADYELTIRKKEALEPPPQVSQPYPYPAYASPQAPPPPPPVAVSAPASAPPSKVVPALPAPGKTSASSHPRLKCPMAGTFYRCPGPGEPPFVKVGDKVQKGQVVCIIEAMKLMNEIEADQSGTITEILVEDGKPVSIDMPLFAIAP
ncbi:biotin carboxyl carrier protein of acetyl-CoA carboxylase, chloroplastic-like [Cicer arietinum]|uniref:Biotin carboxyl carrier protein of acetyl-CoA carboxylase n=1 Tax=Cicer arietinum TaxID=3827 RepID=A0A1S2XHL8_CICAR|nr:biotin carboxyl carrier protein of acetyl-CoA carboxylase, chloroplastic-like [Cicer arietinum]